MVYKNLQIVKTPYFYPFIFSRCNNFCEHGHCNARTFPTNLHDGQDECRKMAIRSSISSSFYLIFDRNKPIWTTWPQNWKMACVLNRNVRNRISPYFGKISSNLTSRRILRTLKCVLTIIKLIYINE